MEPIRLGLVGLNFGRAHAATLANLPGVELVAVAERHPQDPAELAAYAAAQRVRLYADGKEMISEEQLDIVCLATPPHTRGALLPAAIARGMAVFVEKPWASDPAEAVRLAAACRGARAPIMVGFSFRFLPAVARLRELLAGELGSPRQLHGNYCFNWALPPEHWIWTQGGGFFNENSCHLFDAVSALAGRPVSVQAETARAPGRPGDELACVTLRFASGAIAALSLGCAAAPAFKDFPRLDLVTAHGQARLLGRDHIWETLEWALRDAPETRRFDAPSERLGNTRYTLAWRHFLDCVRTGAAPAASIADGILAVQIAAALRESAASGRRVDLPVEANP